MDDLITNTGGALLGAVIAPIVLWWMPIPSEAARERLRARPVTVWRRWLAMAIEAWAWWAIFIVLGVGLRVAALVVDELDGSALRLTESIAGVFAWAVVFAVPGLLGTGSLGLRAVWLVPSRRDGRPAWGLRGLWRASVVSGPWVAAGFYDIEWPYLAALALAAVAVLSVPLTRNRRGISCLAALTDLVDPRGGVEKDRAAEEERVAEE